MHFGEKHVRHVGWFSLGIILFLSFGLAASRVGFTKLMAAETAKLVPASKTSTPVNARPADVPPPVVPNVPPGSALYLAKRGDSIASVAHHYVSQTSFLTSSELAGAMRQANGHLQGEFLKAGQQVLVPGILDAPIVEKSVPVAKDFEVRAIYLTGIMAASDRGLKIVRRWKEVGGNAVVFDVKDSDGL